MSNWTLIAIFAGVFVLSYIFRSKDPQRIDWKAWRLAMRRGWHNKPARTDYTQVMHFYMNSLRPDRNAHADKLAQERDVQAMAAYLMAETEIPREECIDLAERYTGREYAPGPDGPKR